jgi:hypothetical protein
VTAAALNNVAKDGAGGGGGVASAVEIEAVRIPMIRFWVFMAMLGMGV